MERQKKTKGKVYFLKLKYLIKLIKKAGKQKKKSKGLFLLLWNRFSGRN